MPKISSKCCLDWIFFTVTYICVLSTQMQNTTMRSKLIIKSDAQKQMAKSSFGSKSHDL